MAVREDGSGHVHMAVDQQVDGSCRTKGGRNPPSPVPSALTSSGA